MKVDYVFQELDVLPEGFEVPEGREKPWGTAHAVLCAEDALEGPCVVAFADTLFRAKFQLDASADAVIWVNKVDDPRPFGVVKLSEDGGITDFVEKPQEFVSDLAIIGIYYFKDGARLKRSCSTSSTMTSRAVGSTSSRMPWRT